MLGIRTGYTFVRIYGNKLPIVPTLDIVGIIVHLGAVAGKLLLAVRGDTGIGGGAALFLCSERRCSEATDCCLLYTSRCVEETGITASLWSSASRAKMSWGQ